MYTPPPAQAPVAPQTYNYVQPQQYYQPPQQYYQPPSQYYQPPPQQYPPVGVNAPKKSQTGLIIGLVAGGVVLFALAIIIAINIGGLFTPDHNEPIGTFNPPITSTPVPTTPTPDSAVDRALLGAWELESGDRLWYFGESDVITFFDNEDGTFGVHESEHEEPGVWYINDYKNLVVIGAWIGANEFTYILTGDSLMLIDRDGDTAHYTRAR